MTTCPTPVRGPSSDGCVERDCAGVRRHARHPGSDLERFVLDLLDEAREASSSGMPARSRSRSNRRVIERGSRRGTGDEADLDAEEEVVDSTIAVTTTNTTMPTIHATSTRA